jgi:hypothetical protein
VHLGDSMPSAYAAGILLFKKRVFGFWLAAMILLSIFVNLGFNAMAQPDNVTVDGYIKDSGTGMPIDNATIILQNTEDGTVNITKTNATGYYNLSIYVPPGGRIFVISAFHEDYLINSSYIWLTPFINIGQDIYLDPATEKGSFIHGKIIDAVTMSPIPWAGIAALGEDYINTTSTNATGYYWMGLQSNQTYWIQVENNGYMSQGKRTYLNWGNNRSFNFLLEPMNCTLKGYVKTPGGPLGTASVFVYRLDEFGAKEYWPEVDFATGYYELNLSRGVWQVEVQENMHFTQTLTVLMFNGETTWQNFTLIKLPTGSATVQGYVRYYNNGSGVPDAGISVSNLNRTWNYWNTTNSTGWFQISIIPGDIRIEAWAPDQVPVDEELNVLDGGTYNLNLTVFDPKINAWIDGFVKLNGTGESDVDVIASHGRNQYWGLTDLSGYYNISVPGGPLDLQALKNGFKTVFKQVNTTSFQTTSLNITIENLDWSCELNGYVNNTIGDPVDGSYVSFDYDGFGWESSTATTDYTGFYQCMVPEGYSSYFIFPEDHEYTTGEVDLPGDQIYWLNETLNPVDREAKIVCRLTNIYTGSPLSRVKLTLSRQDLNWFEEVETNGNGMVRASVPAGFARISFNAWDNGYKNPGMFEDPSMLQFRLKPGETRWLNISLYPREKTALLHGYVNDTGGSPISGATVYAEYGDILITNVTDGAGYYELYLPGDHSLEIWVRAPGYKIANQWRWINYGDNIWFDWVLEDSNAWITGPVTDSVADLDGDSFYDVLYVNLTVNVAVPGEYKVQGNLRSTRTGHNTIARAEEWIGETPGIQPVSLVFIGELIRSSGKDGYFVEIELISEGTWELLDKREHFTAKYAHNEFDLPDTSIEIPVEQWLVDSDFDGLYNYLVINITLNVSVAGDYFLMGVLRDIWGQELDEPEMEVLSLEAGFQEVQISFEGTSIFNHGKKLGSCYLVLFEDMPQYGNDYIHSLFFYIPYNYDIFQFFTIDAYASGYVTDINDQPIENIEVMLYNTTSKYLNSTKTDVSGYYELGGWGGEWILVVDDSEDDNTYQGNLTEISLVTGTNLTFDVRNLTYIQLDQIEVHLSFSDWNNTHLDWLHFFVGDNETIRFMIDVLQFGDGDGFVSEEEANFVLSFIGGGGSLENSTDIFLVDGIWYDLDLSSETFDAGLVGPVTSEDPIYMHVTGNYTANITIPAPSPHDFTLNCSYDDTYIQSVSESNATYTYYIAVPSGWGRTGNGIPQNVTISGTDFITLDPQGDPDPFDGNISEWVNLTISSGIAPSYGSIKGNVTLQGSGDHSGVMVIVYDNATQLEIASAPTDPSGNYEILGLNPGTYDIVAHKSGYGDNRSDGHIIIAGVILWLDFTLYSYPPVISHTPVIDALLGEPIEIYAQVTDDGQVDEVLLYYKDVGSGSYVWTNMSKIASTSTFVGTIPAQSQVGYVYYYIWANDTRGNFATHPDIGNYTIQIYELDPPDISNVIALPDPAEYPEVVNISAIVTDFSIIETVTLFLEMPDSSTSNTTMDYDGTSGKYYINSSYPMLGTYNFTIWAKDSFNNWNSFSGSFDVQDILPPTSNVEALIPYWFSTSPITVTVTASDLGIGIAEVELWYRNSTDNSTWGVWTLFGTDNISPYQWSFDFPAGDGYYEFFSMANDSVGNSEAMKFSAETICGYDASAPTSSVDVIVTYWHTTSPLTMTATASSSMSSIESVELWYRYSSNDLNWGSWISFGTDMTSPWSWSFNFPNDEGFYEFYSRATDLLGNVEIAPGLADTECAFDTSGPSISSFSALPDPCELGESIDISARFSDVSGINGAWVLINLDGTQVGNFSMTLSGQDYQYLYSTSDIGTVSLVLWVVDANDHWSSTSTSIPVQDTTQPSITNLTISPSNPQVGSTVRVRVDLSDMSNINAASINITTPDGDWLLNQSMIKTPGTDTYYYETDYLLLGEYQFVIWVEDGNAIWSSLIDSVTTRDTQPPQADAGLEQQVSVGILVTLDASLSTDNYGIANYTWSFYDSGQKTLYGMVTNYTFNTAINYEITLAVRDFGDNSDIAITWINVSSATNTGTVIGTVVDEDDNPIEGVIVYVEAYPSIQNETDSFGRFILEEVPIGDQKLIFIKDGFERDSEDCTVEQDQTTSTGDEHLVRSPESKEETPLALFAALGAIIAVIAVLLLFLLMKRMKQAKAGKTVIDEVFFMYNDGRLIKHFTRRLKPDMDEDILSSMLVAVQDFIKDSFRDQEGILDEMKFGRFQVLLGRGKHIMLATVVLGEEIEPFRPQVQKCIDDIEEKYADVLEEWDGELSKLMGASKYIMDLIDGRYA